MSCASWSPPARTLRCSRGRAVLVTDAVAVAGLPPGVYVAAVSRDGTRGIINTRALEGSPALPAPQPMTYDGETEAARLARRNERWTPIAT